MKLLPEIQALRALAVALVVTFHVWPGRVPGGFVGVDVFFVISGFLITSHLMRERDRTGGVSVTEFWARRIRRLLPAAYLVLAASVLMVVTALRHTGVEYSLKQVAAASAYVVNWVLAADFSAGTNQSTLVHHYWTLSVEEQFYIAWPLLLVVVTRLTRSNTRAFAVVAAGVVVSSFAYWAYVSATAPEVAYFSTATRAWQFAAGGVLAVTFALYPSLRSIRSSPLTVAGFATLALCAFVPGMHPLPPVLAALTIIVGGMPRSPVVAGVIGSTCVQFVGDVSYSLYLWHWPLIATFSALLGAPPSLAPGLAIIAASVGLAALTKYFVEDPVRRSPWLTARRWPAFAFAALGTIFFVTLWLVL